MPLSWNEIRHNAIKFSGEWMGAKSEHAEKQTFWNEFFQVFGIKRRVVASFEEPAKRISGTYGFIDLLWRGVLLVEHKSFGEDLGKAKAQAFNYRQVKNVRHGNFFMMRWKPRETCSTSTKAICLCFKKWQVK